MDKQTAERIALFRFGVIAPLVDRHLSRGDRERIIDQIVSSTWQIPGSRRTSVGRSTVSKWLSEYLRSGANIESLKPQQRSDKGSSRSMDAECEAALVALKQEFPHYSLQALLQVARQRKIIDSRFRASKQSVYRMFARHGLNVSQPATVDRRKFEAELPNDLWQCDIMHGPLLQIGDKRRKSYLIAFLDDHSRLIPHGRFYPSEALAPFLEAFETALRKRGLPRKLYVDNGSAFRSRQLEYTTAALGIVLIHAKPYQPQGKGKVERFFKTVRTQFLSGFTGESFEVINAAFDRWLEERYHQRAHSATSQSPLKRFTAKMQCLRSAPENLSDYFRKTVRRRVNKDRSVVVDKRLFEAPVELVGKRVELLYHEHSPEQVEIRCAGRSYGLLRQVDLHVNSRVKRDRNGQVELVGQGICDGGRLWEG